MASCLKRKSFTAGSRETWRTLPSKVYVQEESATPSSDESNGTVSNYIVTVEIVC